MISMSGTPVRRGLREWDRWRLLLLLLVAASLHAALLARAPWLMPLWSGRHACSACSALVEVEGCLYTGNLHAVHAAISSCSFCHGCMLCCMRRCLLMLSGSAPPYGEACELLGLGLRGSSDATSASRWSGACCSVGVCSDALRAADAAVSVSRGAL